MTAEELRAALEALGWSHAEAARRLHVLMKGKPNRQRIGEWCRGERTVPAYVAGHVHTLLELKRCRDENGVRTPSGGGTPMRPLGEIVR